MRSFRSLLITIVALAAPFLPSLTFADGITWTINDATFSGGDSITGSFNYDATTNLYSSPNVSTTAGGLFGATTYNTVTDAIFATPTVVGLGPNPFADFNGGNLTGATVLEIIFNNPLTNAGDTDSIYAIEFLCNDATCSSPATRTTTSGFVTGTPISTPEPASLLFLASGLFAVLLLRLRA